MALSEYREQAQILAEASVDFFILEMIVRASDAQAAAQAAAETGLPVWIGYSLRDRTILWQCGLTS